METGGKESPYPGAWPVGGMKQYPAALLQWGNLMRLELLEWPSRHNITKFTKHKAQKSLTRSTRDCAHVCSTQDRTGVCANTPWNKAGSSYQ